MIVLLVIVVVIYLAIGRELLRRTRDHDGV